MKTFLTLIMVLAFALPAFADSTVYQATMLSQTTGASSIYKTTGYPKKTIIVGSISGTGFANYSGLFTAYGCIASTGNCYPLKDVQGVAVAKTHDLTAAGAVFVVDDLSDWIKVNFTKTSSAAKNVITVIMNYAQSRVAQ